MIPCFFQVNDGIRNRVIAFFLLLVIALAIAFGIYTKMKDDRTPIPIALVAPLSGKEAEAGQEMVQAVQLYLDTVNQQGGVNGHPLKLLIFDDEADKEVAKVRAPEIVSSPAVVLLGHRSSSPSAAGAEFYEAAHLAAISGTSNDDEVTLKYPYYFRATYTRSLMFKVLSLYSQQVLGTDHISIIQYDEYGIKLGGQLAEAFIANGSTIKNTWTVDSDPPTLSIKTIVDQLAADPNPGLVFFAFRAEEIAKELLVEIRRRGLNSPILLGQPLSREEFSRAFEDFEEEQKSPGFFTNGVYATSPLLFDSAGLDAQEFANTYFGLYGKLPSYVGTKFYEAAVLAVQAIDNANIHNKPDRLEANREQIRTELAKITNRNVAPRGLTGLLYFNSKTRSSESQPVRIAQFQKRVLISASQQFEAVSNPERENLPQELAADRILQIGDDYFWKQNVVYTGIDLNRLNRVDQKFSKFTAEFYLWFRYAGDADLEHIEFLDGKHLIPNQPLFDPKNPIESSTIDGLNYRLYQIRGEFKNSFNLRDYPFDRQHLTLRFQNSTTPSDRLIYAIDTLGLRLPKTDLIADQIRYSLPLWKYQGIQYAKETFRTTSTEGDPNLFQTDNQVDYPGLSATIRVKRRSIVFLIKNLLPLILLTLVLMMTLYFPKTLTKERLSVAISALGSGTVLLVGVYNQLPEIGYTSAIEYMFYIFFGLSLFSIWVGIFGNRLLLKNNKRKAIYLDWIARIIYLFVILFTAIGFWIAFGER
jgi:branched-chain amino acid transport system substrate-binding protein